MDDWEPIMYLVRAWQSGRHQPMRVHWGMAYASRQWRLWRRHLSLSVMWYFPWNLISLHYLSGLNCKDWNVGKFRKISFIGRLRHNIRHRNFSKLSPIFWYFSKRHAEQMENVKKLPLLPLFWKIWKFSYLNFWRFNRPNFIYVFILSFYFVL